MDEGWTEVRYGRRRQRTRQPRWDQGYGGVQWVDGPLMSAGRKRKTFNQSKTAVTSNVELVT